MAILILTSCVFLLLFTAMFIYKLLAKSTIAPPREIQNAINSDPDFEISEGVLIKYKGTAEVVAIPEGVTSIGGCAFYDCRGLTSITIGNSVTSIGAYAFSYCTGLTEITIPDSVTSIDYLSFYGCTNLRHISVPGHFTDQQILDLGLPLECMIERRELAILPPRYELGWLADTNNFQLNRVDQAVRNLLIAFSLCMKIGRASCRERV